VRVLDQAILELVFLGRVAAAFNRVAVCEQPELGAGECVADPVDEFLGGVPVAVLDDVEQLLDLGGARAAVVPEHSCEMLIT